MRTFSKFISLLVLAVLVSAIEAKTVYVNNVVGSDFNSGTLSESQGERVGPLRTIAAALRITHRGDKVELANTPVPYEECISLQGARHSGFEFAPFVLNGNGATLDGTSPVPANKWEFVEGDLHRFVPDRGGFQMLFLNGEPAKQLPRFDGNYVSSFLQPKEWCRCRGGIHFMPEKGKAPYSYDLRYAKHRVGITLYDVEHVIIENLTVRGFQLDGINAHDNAMNCALYDVTASANGRSGISINGASRVKIVECKANDNGVTQLRCDGWSTTNVILSELEAEDRPVWTRHVNRRGQGARLRVDDVVQYELQGMQTKPKASREPIDETVPEVAPTPELSEESRGPREIDEPVEAPVVDEDDLFNDADASPAEQESIDEEPQDDSATDDGDPFGDLGDDADFGEMDQDDPFAEGI